MSIGSNFVNNFVRPSSTLNAHLLLSAHGLYQHPGISNHGRI